MNYSIYILVIFCARTLSAQPVVIGGNPDDPTAERNGYRGFPIGFTCSDAYGSEEFTPGENIGDYPGGENPTGDYFTDGEPITGDYPSEYPEGDYPDEPGDGDAVDELSDGIEEGEDDDYLDDSHLSSPNYGDDVLCIITKNGEVLFNKTIVWDMKRTEGYFGEVDESWIDAEIVVSAEWGDNEAMSAGYTVKVLDPNPHDCVAELEEKPDVTTIVIGKLHDEPLSCFADEGMPMNEEQFDSITTVWYRGCDVISRDDPNFEYLEQEFFVDEVQGMRFDGLRVTNPSFKTTPGEYRCALVRNGVELARNYHTICLKEPFEYANKPAIKTSQNIYKAPPGGSVTFTCQGNTGTESDSASLSVQFGQYKGAVEPANFETACRSFLARPSDEQSCDHYLHQNKDYCRPLTDEEISEIPTHELDDYFIASHTKQNLTKTDNGSIYHCILHTTRGLEVDEFLLIVEDEIRSHQPLTITLVVIGALIFLAFIVLLFYHIYRIEVQYLIKKYFGKPVTIEAGHYVAYLVYESSAYNGSNNIVEDVKKYIRPANYVYDPNVNQEDAGGPVGDHYQAVLEKSLRLVIIVTPQLIEQNEIEIFKVYGGLNENVQRDLKLVFVCTRETKNEIKRKARGRKETAITLQKFMKKQGSRVIYWKKGEQHNLNRALYVALPNVQPIENNNEIITRL